jgi:NAD+ synthase
MKERQAFSKQALNLDAAQEVERICEGLRDLLAHQLKRRGLVIGLSGGIDSSVTAALAVRAIGPQRVFGLLMPERHSAEETLVLSETVARQLGITTVHEDISGVLEAVGCYQRYQDAIRSLIPEYGDGWRSKIAISNAMDGRGFSLFYLVAEGPDGTEVKKRLPAAAYLEIVAATNFKQRTRKMLEYYHADRLHYAVAGTPNRLEYDQGFFVKLGDGAADVKPIAHLYKSQVYQLAEYLGLPEEIRSRPPTTDTYSLPQGQDEFYFSVPYHLMDLCLYGKNNSVAAREVAAAAGLTEEQVRHIYADIDIKRSTTRYLHLPPLLVEKVGEIELQEKRVSG